MSPDGEGEDAESPMPHPSQFGGKEKRRGAVSAEPITEEDITAYVKKVFNVIYISSHFLRRHTALVKRIRPYWLWNSCKKAFHLCQGFLSNAKSGRAIFSNFLAEYINFNTVE